MSLTLFPIPEIEELIFGYIDIIHDGKNLMLVNKYFCNIIRKNPIYSEFRFFHELCCRPVGGFFLLPSTTKKFVKACKFGHIHVCKYIVSKDHHNRLETYMENNDAFVKCCLNGQLEIAKWLDQLVTCPQRPHTCGSITQTFIKCCYRGQINVAKWLYQSKPTIKNDLYHDVFFANCCEKGKLEIVKWLYQSDLIYSESIHKHYRHIFKISCRHGHLELAQWIYYLKFEEINIRMENNYAFRWACMKNKLDVAQWLTTLCPEYKLIIENNKITFYQF